MSKNILISDNLDKADDELLPFPRGFAECVADILKSTDDKRATCRDRAEGRKFVSSFGLVLK